MMLHSLIGMKDVLLTWHDADPVDAAEVARSLGVESAQGNRNPFIHDTTLVRRAYFGGTPNPTTNPPNPVTGKVSDITANSFKVEYAKGSGTATASFDVGQGFEAQDTAGVAFTLTEYTAIEEAKVTWEAGSEEGTYIATKIEVLSFLKKNQL